MSKSNVVSLFGNRDDAVLETIKVDDQHVTTYELWEEIMAGVDEAEKSFEKIRQDIKSFKYTSDCEYDEGGLELDD